jgi:hypothetical protein
MNVLFEVLSERPSVLSDLVTEPTAPLERLLDRLDVALPDSVLSEIAESHERGFLPVISAEQFGVPTWESDPLLPGPVFGDLETFGDVARWVTFIPAPDSRDLGLSVPDDRSPFPNVAVFTRTGDGSDGELTRLTFQLTPDRERLIGSGLGTGGDCGDPVGTGCQRNLCGDCVNQILVIKGFAARACRCPHG